MTQNDNFHNWKIEHGDYKRDPESTNTYLKKVERQRLIKKIVTYSLILIVIIILVKIFFF